MKLILKRIYKGPMYTIGSLYIDDKYLCDTIEDADRGLSNEMKENEILKKKVYGETAIPTGKYNITLEVVSNKYKNSPFYKQYANGSRVPRLLDVKGFSGILIHTGNSATDSLGCIIVGKNTIKGKVTESKETFKKLYSLLQESNKKGEKITIEIV